VLGGGNAFLSGAAGTGKSYLSKYLIQQLMAKHGPDGVAVCAPTGIAATNVGGITLHSWAGIGIGSAPAETLVARVLRSSDAAERWCRTSVLIIDEVSMLDSELFDALDAIGQVGL
jgi:ATP-dependent DNA helicase PIF1